MNTKSDGRNYLILCMAVLLNGVGGVVARLWRRDNSKFHHRLEQVCTGPTESALWKGIRVKLGDWVFYDDELTSQMDAYICRQYEPVKSKNSHNFIIKLHLCTLS